MMRRILPSGTLDVLAVGRVGAVADADVEVAVGPELQLAAVVVRGGWGMLSTVQWPASVTSAPGAAWYSQTTSVPFGCVANA